jgi:plasmid stabilization system protein ParE
VKIEILSLAEQDLLEGYHFYEKQAPGLGNYFLENIYSDIDSLARYAGIHMRPHKNFYRLLSKKFPFAIYYTVEGETAFVHAVLDGRRNPEWTQRRLARVNFPL